MAEDINQPVETVRMYTRARKFPLLIGRFPDGKQVPGGPYTLPQLMGGALTLAALWFLRAIWAHFGAIMNLALAAIIAAGVVYGLGRLPQTGRSPWSRLGGLGKAATRSATPRVNGQPVKIRRLHTVAGITTVFDSRLHQRALVGGGVVDRSLDKGPVPAAPAAQAEQRPSPVVEPAKQRPLPDAEERAASVSRPRRQPSPPPASPPSPASPPATSIPARRRRNTAPPATAAPPWLAPASTSQPTTARDKPEISAHREDQPTTAPRVQAAAGTGVAQLLALAADAQRKSE